MEVMRGTLAPFPAKVMAQATSALSYQGRIQDGDAEWHFSLAATEDGRIHGHFGGRIVGQDIKGHWVPGVVCTFRIGGALIGESVIARQSGNHLTGHAGGRFQGVRLQAEIRGTQLVVRYHCHWASPGFTVDLEDMPPLLGIAIMTLACYHLTQVYHTPEIS